MIPSAPFRAHPPPADRAAILRPLIAGLAARAEIMFAYLHGSFAEGLAYHDIDVAVHLAPDAASTDLFDYAAELSTELTRAVGQEVDVQVLNGAGLGFQHAVLQGEVLLVRDEEALADFIERVSIPYMEYAGLARQHLRELLAPW